MIRAIVTNKLFLLIALLCVFALPVFAHASSDVKVNLVPSTGTTLSDFNNTWVELTDYWYFDEYHSGSTVNFTNVEDNGGTYYVTTSNMPADATVLMATCTYPRGGSECTPAANTYSTSGFSCYSEYGDSTYCYTDGLNLPDNMVTKISFKVSVEKGGIKVAMVGPNLSSGTVPEGMYVSLDGQEAMYDNPTTFSSVSAVTHQISVSEADGYAMTYGTCTYPVGGSECTVTSYPTVPSCYYGSCNINVAIANDVVTKIVFRYNNSRGDIEVYRVGSDGTVATVPPGTRANMNGVVENQYGYNGSTPANPGEYLNILAAANVYVTDLNLFVEYVGSCTYVRGGTPCTVTNFSLAATTSGNAYVGVSLTNNYVTKVAFKYLSNVNNGDIQIYRVGSDGTTRTAPLSSVGSLSVGELSGCNRWNVQCTYTNPRAFSNIAIGTTTIGASRHSDFTSLAGYCLYARGSNECTVTNFSIVPTGDDGYEGAYAGIPVQGGMVTKVVVKYTNVLGAAGTGDIQIYRYGSNGTTLTAPLGSKASTGYGNYYGWGITTNPALVPNVEATTTVVSTSDHAAFSPMAGYCFYPRGSAECTVTTFDITPGASYYGGLPFSVPVQSGMVTKVGVKYTSGASVGEFHVYRVGADNTIATAPFGYGSGVDTAYNQWGSYYYGDTVNPSIFADLSPATGRKVSSHSYQNSTSTAITSVQTCSYAKGSSECSSYTTLPFIYGTVNDAYVNATPTAGYIQKFIFKYNNTINYGATSTGDVKFKLVGPDDTVNTSPNTTYLYNVQGKMDGSNIAFGTNAGDRLAQTVGSHTMSVDIYQMGTADFASYAKSAGTCTYNIGAEQCVVSDFNITPTCDTSSCAINFNVLAGKVTKVVFKFDKNVGSGSIKIKGVGIDETTSTFPDYYLYALVDFTPYYNQAGGYVGSPQLGSYPNKVYDATGYLPGAHQFYFKDLPGYNQTYGTCTYSIGAEQCTVTSFPSAAVCGIAGIGSLGYANICNATTTIVAGKVTKIVIKAESFTASGDVKVKRVGVDETTATAPYTTAWVDNSSSATNPLDIANVSAGSHIVFATDLSTYQETAGMCTYAKGSPECRVTVFDITPTCSGVADAGNNIKCAVPITVSSGQVTKVVFKYDGVSAAVTGVGDIKVKAVGSDDTVATVPSTPTLSADTYSGSAYGTVLDVVSVAVGAHVVYTTNMSGYIESAGSCTYVRGANQCTVTSFNLPVYCSYYTCGTKISVTGGTVTKVVFKYTAGSDSYLDGNGEVKVEHVDQNGTMLPSAYYYVSFNSNPSSNTANPSTWSLSAGYNEIHLSLGGYQVSANTCTYDTGSSECTLNGSYEPVQCISNYCAFPLLVQNGKTTKIRLKYSSIGGGTGNVLVYRYGANGATSSAPAINYGVGINATGITAGWSNNTALLSNIPNGPQTAELANNLGYAKNIGYCTYPIGGSECTISSFATTIDAAVGDNLRFPLTVTAGQVTKVGIMYSQLDYNMYSSQAQMFVTPGYSDQTYITLTQTIGVAVPVSLSVSGLPSGATATFSPSSATCTPNCEVTMTVKVGTSVAAGTYKLTVTGQPLNKKSEIDLVVGSPVTPVAQECSLSDAPNWSAVSGSSQSVASLGSNGNEPTLQEMLTDVGYSINAASDQDNYQTWKSTTTAGATIDVQLLDGHSGRTGVFGYYTAGDINTFVPLFKKKGTVSAVYPSVTSIAPGEKASFTIPANTTISFAVFSEKKDGTGTMWKTQSSANTDSQIHAVSYFEPSVKGYVIGFEDLPSSTWDHDYNDMVVRVRTSQCSGNTPVQNPVLSCSANYSSAPVGTSITWKATISNPNGSYSYSWSGTDSLSGTASTISKSYSTTGSKTGTVTVAGLGSCSKTITVTGSGSSGSGDGGGFIEH